MTESASRVNPTFIGIGATKSGSSWLYSNLANHSQVFAPIKEINYFTEYTEKGIEWYQSLFHAGKDYLHTGEITPTYLYHPHIPELVASNLPDVKIIVILRNPVHRSYSQYKSNYYTGSTKCHSYSDYLIENPSTLQRGYYYEHLSHWIKHIPKKNIKVLIFEESVKNPEFFKRELSDFLGIEKNGFDDRHLTQKANVSNPPKLRHLYRLGYKISQSARRLRLFRLSKYINKTGSIFFSFIGDSSKKAPELEDQIYEQLIKQFQSDILKLTEFMGRDTPIWK